MRGETLLHCRLRLLGAVWPGRARFLLPCRGAVLARVLLCARSERLGSSQLAPAADEDHKPRPSPSSVSLSHASNRGSCRGSAERSGPATKPRTCSPCRLSHRRILRVQCYDTTQRTNVTDGWRANGWQNDSRSAEPVCETVACRMLGSRTGSPEARQPGQAAAQARAYSPGERPTAARKSRIRWAWSAKPRSVAMEAQSSRSPRARQPREFDSTSAPILG